MVRYFVTSGLLLHWWKYTDTIHIRDYFDIFRIHVRPESPVSIPGVSMLDLWSAEWQRQVYPDYFGFPVVSSYSAHVPYSYICICLWRCVLNSGRVAKSQKLTCIWISHAWDTLVRRTICGFYSQVCVYFKSIFLGSYIACVLFLGLHCWQQHIKICSVLCGC